MSYYKNKVAVVTGAANGIGLGIAAEIANRGGSVVMVDILADDLNKAVAELKAKKLDVTGYEMDVTIEADWPKLLDFALKTYKKVDFLFNNAGIEYAKKPSDFNTVDWEYYWKANVMSVVWGTKTFAAQMKKQGSGHISTTASTASLGPIPGDGIGEPYAPSKAACLMFMEQYAIQMKMEETNITCSTIMPCVINTDIGLRIDNPLSVPLEFRDKMHLIDNRSDETKAAAQATYAGLHAPKDSPEYAFMKSIGVIEVEDGVKTILEEIEKGYFYIYTHPGQSHAVNVQQMTLRILAYRQPESQADAQGEFSQLSKYDY